MIYYLAFGPLYRFPRNLQEDTVGYGFTLDIGKYCKELNAKELCNGSKDSKKCEEEIMNIPLCIETVDKWLHSVNEMCYDKVNLLENCIDEGRNCIDPLNSLYRCESEIDKPEWIDPQGFRHFQDISRPISKQTNE